MPFTPFHLGPGLLLKAIAPARFSFTAYAATQVVIDVETLFHMLRDERPFHRELHTYLLGGLAGAAVGMLAHVLGASLATRLQNPEEARLAPALAGGVIGGTSHALIDGLVHRDVTALWPFTSSKVLSGMVPLATMHACCLAAAAIGVVWLATRSVVGRRSRAARQ